MKKTLSVGAVIVGIIGFILHKQPTGAMLAVFAIILAIVALKKEQAHAWAIAGLVIGILIMGSYVSFGKAEEKTEDVAVEKIEQQNYEYVFCAYLLDDAQKYNNRYVSTIIPIEQVSTNHINVHIDGFSPAITARDIDMTGFSNGDWVKLSGKINAEYSYDVEFMGAVVEKVDRPATFDADMDHFNSEKRTATIAERDTFIQTAETVSYDDLRRYPDTYKGKPLKLEITVTEAKPDGAIMRGDIMATYEGQEIAVYDGRAVREPRLMTGDTLTIYAQGNGLDKIQQKDGSGLFAKTINEYEIPCVRLVYTDFDAPDNIATPTEDGDLTNEGREAGEKMLETLQNIDW